MNIFKEDLNAVVTNDWYLIFRSTRSLMGHSFSKSSECQFVLNIGQKYITREAMAITQGFAFVKANVTVLLYCSQGLGLYTAKRSYR